MDFAPRVGVVGGHGARAPERQWAFIIIEFRGGENLLRYVRTLAEPKFRIQCTVPELESLSIYFCGIIRKPLMCSLMAEGWGLKCDIEWYLWFEGSKNLRQSNLRACLATTEEVATIPLRNGLSWRNGCNKRSAIWCPRKITLPWPLRKIFTTTYDGLNKGFLAHNFHAQNWYLPHTLARHTTPTTAPTTTPASTTTTATATGDFHSCSNSRYHGGWGYKQAA